MKQFAKGDTVTITNELGQPIVTARFDSYENDVLTLGCYSYFVDDRSNMIWNDEEERWYVPAHPLIDVEVWDYVEQDWFPSIKCPGEKRVRVDYFGDLENLAVFQVERLSKTTFMAVGEPPVPLKDWRIDLS